LKDIKLGFLYGT